MKKIELFHGTCNGDFLQFEGRFKVESWPFRFTLNKEKAKEQALNKHRYKNFMGRPYLYRVAIHYSRALDMRKLSKYFTESRKFKEETGVRFIEVGDVYFEMLLKKCDLTDKEYQIMSDIDKDQWLDLEIHYKKIMKEHGYDLFISSDKRFDVYDASLIEILSKEPLFNEKENRLEKLEKATKRIRSIKRKWGL